LLGSADHGNELVSVGCDSTSAATTGRLSMWLMFFFFFFYSSLKNLLTDELHQENSKSITVLFIIKFRVKKVVWILYQPHRHTDNNLTAIPHLPMSYKVADTSLAAFSCKEIQITENEKPGLMYM